MKNFLWKIKRILDKLFGTVINELQWKFRHVFLHKNWAAYHLTEKKIESSRMFWKEYVKKYIPYESFLEIGCGPGNNLYAIAREFPNAHYYGIDISMHALSTGKAYIMKQGIKNIQLISGRAQNLKHFPAKSIDIVFSDATLIYIGPDKIDRVVREIFRVAKKAIFLAEYMTEKPYEYIEDYWAYDWRMLFKNAGAKTIRFTKITEAMRKSNWAQYGYIVEVELNPPASSAVA